MDTHTRDLTRADDDRLVVAEALAWVRSLSWRELGPQTREALLDVHEQIAIMDWLVAIDADREAVEYVAGCVVILAVRAQAVHERESGELPEEISDPISPAEFRRRHIAPLQAEGRRVVRRMERHHRCDPTRRRSTRRARPRARRSGARRAAGVRSGADPGDDDPAPADLIPLGAGTWGYPAVAADLRGEAS